MRTDEHVGAVKAVCQMPTVCGGQWTELVKEQK